jgi:hypothetical protein
MIPVPHLIPDSYFTFSLFEVSFFEEREEVRGTGRGARGQEGAGKRGGEKGRRRKEPTHKDTHTTPIIITKKPLETHHSVGENEKQLNPGNYKQ